VPTSPCPNSSFFWSQKAGPATWTSQSRWWTWCRQSSWSWWHQHMTDRPHQVFWERIRSLGDIKDVLKRGSNSVISYKPQRAELDTGAAWRYLYLQQKYKTSKENKGDCVISLTPVLLRVHSSFLRYPLTPVSPCRTFCCSRYRYCNSEAELILSLSNTQLITTNGFRGDNFAGVSSSFFSDEKSQVWNCKLDKLVSHMPLSPNDCIV